MSEKTVRAAAYIRISREDKDEPESNSVINQRAMIRHFAKDRGIRIEREYVDDGFSGTNFERPAFRQLVGDIKSGMINCIIVKDLSRFGRNVTESGRYLEHLFPEWGVRFIAITDFFDSDNYSDAASVMTVAFKNLVNELYSRDISMKIRGTFDMKRRNGEFIGSFAAFGYMKDPDDKNALVIDEPAARVVRSIYTMKINGMNQQAIAERLNSLGEPTPLLRKQMQGMNIKCAFRKNRSLRWQPAMISRILRNEIYTGTLVQKKREKTGFKSGKVRDVVPEDQIRINDNHKAIISDEMFKYVAHLLSRTTYTAKGKTRLYLFSGFLICGDCGRTITRFQQMKNGRRYVYYQCSGYKNTKACTPHRIREEELLEKASDQIFQRMDEFIAVEGFLKNLLSDSDGTFRLPSAERRMKETMAEADHCRAMRGHAYRDMIQGIISQRDYIEIDDRYRKRLESALGKQEIITAEQANIKDKIKKLLSWLDMVRRYRSEGVITREMLAVTVEYIFVYEGGRTEIRFFNEEFFKELYKEFGGDKIGKGNN